MLGGGGTADYSQNTVRIAVCVTAGRVFIGSARDPTDGLYARMVGGVVASVCGHVDAHAVEYVCGRMCGGVVVGV